MTAGGADYADWYAGVLKRVSSLVAGGNRSKCETDELPHADSES